MTAAGSPLASLANGSADAGSNGAGSNGAGSNGAGRAPTITAKGLEEPKRPTNLTYSAPSEDGEAEVVGSDTVTNADDEFAGISRNQLCPCGSGKKYKRCHGAPNGPTGQTTRAGG